jgi:hypothetical protein
MCSFNISIVFLRPFTLGEEAIYSEFCEVDLIRVFEEVWNSSTNNFLENLENLVKKYLPFH